MSRHIYRGRHRKARPSLSVRFWSAVLLSVVPVVLSVSACTPRHDGHTVPSPGMATMLDHNIPSTAPGACHADCGVE